MHRSDTGHRHNNTHTSNHRYPGYNRDDRNTGYTFTISDNYNNCDNSDNDNYFHDFDGSDHSFADRR